MAYLKYIMKGLSPKKLYYISSTAMNGLLERHNSPSHNDVHIKAAMEWLSLAQKQNGDGGVSALYSLFEGWGNSYVETTGYIIPTFFNYASASSIDIYRQEAIEMADFELSSQLPSGAFPGGGKKGMPVVFNTGQVTFGLCRAFEETNASKYMHAAQKAANWLVSVMDKDGCWRKHEYLGHIHTYNTRTAFALLCAYKISKNNNYRKAAEKNIDWALTQQLENGWMQNCAFYPGQEPLLHTIAYAINGILDAAIFLRKKRYLEAAINMATHLMNNQRQDGSLAGSFDKEWKSSVKWSCLTGNSQMSIIWEKLYIFTKDKQFLDAAKKSNDFMKKVQSINSKNPNIKGGIAGAYPIYGWYAPFCFPNWAAKFFVDALMLENNPMMHEKII